MLTKSKPQSSEPQALQAAQTSPMVPKITAAVDYAADMEAVMTILRRLVKPQAIQPWLHRNNPLLGLRTPISVIQQGGAEQVIEILARLEEGIYL